MTAEGIPRRAALTETGTFVPPPWVRTLGYALLAALAYIPLLLTSPGKLAADTKAYLYLDPGRLLERAPLLWTPNISAGTSTHQQIGYLWPQGPYYWVMHMLGVPGWLSQRLWLGSILLLAALGVLYLMRTLHVRGPGVPVAMVLFMLSPYILNFADRASVLLLPMAGLPWMLALTIHALRDDEGRGWKYPALFALVVVTVGSINLSALIYVGVAPVLWIVYSVLVTRELRWRRALMTALKIGALSILASLWWIVALVVERGAGASTLEFTETFQAVALTSSVAEVLRGLGYWFFYGHEKLGPRVAASDPYVQDIWLIVVSFAVPVLAMFATAWLRWRHRVFFMLLVVVGVMIAVGGHPFEAPSALGALWKALVNDTSFGLALRNTPRAVPMIALGFAVLLGVAVNAMAGAWSMRGYRARGLVLAALLIVLVLANMPSLLGRTLYGKNGLRDEDIPQYWTDAIAALDAGPHDTRIMEIPGSDFASYRWGTTLDPITPFLTDRPYVVRELEPHGSAGLMNLLFAFDGRLQDQVLEQDAIAPVARLLSVGDLVYRADLQTDRYNLTAALPTWLFLTQPAIPQGLAAPTTYGSSLGPPLQIPKTDEVALALPPGTPDPAPVTIFNVKDTPKIVHATSENGSLIVSGDGSGLVDLGGLGALDDSRLVLYSASYSGHEAALRKAAARGDAVLVVTDSNRKRPERWGIMSVNTGATERATETRLKSDANDQRVDVFPGESTDAQTVVRSPGARVTVSRYGSDYTLFPEVRGARAFDGDLDTSWQTGSYTHVLGDKIRLDLDSPIETDRVRLVQSLVGRIDRYITRATLTFDGKDPVTVDLTGESRTPEGQMVVFPTRSFHRLEITVDDTNVGDAVPIDFTNPVGFAEIGVRDKANGAQDIRVDEIVRLPTDLVDALGTSTAGHALVFSFNRSRTNVIPPRFSQDEVALIRQIRVADARTFGVRGGVRVASDAADDVLDSVLGLPDAEHGGLTVRASIHLPGDVAARGSSAFDGNPATAWNTAYGLPAGQWVEFDTPKPVTFDHFDMQVVADGRHSVPTQIRIDSGDDSRIIDLPPVVDSTQENATVSVPVQFAPMTTSNARITITEVRNTFTEDYYCDCPLAMPAAIAEFGIPGVQRAPLPAALPTTCRTDLLQIDDRAVGVRILGSTAAAEARQAVDLQLCDPADPTASSTVAFPAGDHVVRSQSGKVTGIDFDRLVLGSDRTGAAMALGDRGSLTDALRATSPVQGAPAPTVEVTNDGATKLDVKVTGAQPGTPFWLVLGQSQNTGWQATIDGKTRGDSTLVNGYANGWLVNPGSSSFSVTFDWTPQHQVWLAIWISAAAVLLCLFLALRGLRRRRRPHAAPDAVAGGTGSPDVDDVVDGGVDAEGEIALANPLVGAGTRPPRMAIILAPIATALVGWFVASWWVGLLGGLGVLAVLLERRLRGVLALGAPLVFASVALYVAVSQYRHNFEPKYFWPEYFDRVNDLAWLAVLLLGCDALVEILRTRRWRATPEPAVTGQEPDSIP